MLTNLESQLREQNAGDKLDAVLDEIPRVREDLGMLPLVTPTSQIVGTQAVINVLSGKRYATISKETSGVLKGEYGATPAPVNTELQSRVLDGAEAITCRPADLIAPEVDRLSKELQAVAAEKGLCLADDVIDDVLTYALFPQIGLRFLENRDDPGAFEPVPSAATAAVTATAAVQGAAVYSVRVNGKQFTVEVAATGELSDLRPVAGGRASDVGGHRAGDVGGGHAGDVGGRHAGDVGGRHAGDDTVKAVLAGNIFDVLVAAGDEVAEGQPLLVVEAMKMETAVCAPKTGIVTAVHVATGDIVAVGDPLVTLS
jgi:oxaloacetate decarboxylase alpha subunit